MTKEDTKAAGVAESAEEVEAIDLDADTSSELDLAMRQALEAIESSERPGAKSSDNDDTPAVADEDALEALRGEAAKEREHALRARADLENFRKRVQRERQDERKFRAFDSMREFVSVVDNLERAMAAAGSIDDLKQGLQMILKQMGNLLSEHGVERIAALGASFDPSLHEAVGRHEDPKVTVPTVSDEMQAGYTMHERLLRPAVVRVAMPGSAADGSSGASGN